MPFQFNLMFNRVVEGRKCDASIPEISFAKIKVHAEDT